MYYYLFQLGILYDYDLKLKDSQAPPSVCRTGLLLCFYLFPVPLGLPKTMQLFCHYQKQVTVCNYCHVKDHATENGKWLPFRKTEQYF